MGERPSLRFPTTNGQHCGSSGLDPAQARRRKRSYSAHAFKCAIPLSICTGPKGLNGALELNRSPPISAAVHNFTLR